MARKPREFGTKQAIMLDNVTAHLISIDEKAKELIGAIRKGDTATVIIGAGDIRNMVLEARHKIGAARRGEYTG